MQWTLLYIRQYPNMKVLNIRILFRSQQCCELAIVITALKRIKERLNYWSSYKCRKQYLADTGDVIS